MTARFGKDWRFDQSSYEIQLDGLNPILISSYDNRYGLDELELWKRDDLNAVLVTFASHGYETDEIALAAAQKLQHAIALMGGRIGGAVDPGFLDMLDEEPTATIRVGAPGSFATKASYSGGGRTFATTAASLTAGLSEGIAQYPLAKDRLRALAVLANNEFPGGLWGSLDDGLGRLVARVSAIEAMCKPARRSGEVQECIAGLVQFVDGFPNLSDDERNTLKNGIQRLKTESISQSCRSFVAAALGEEPLAGAESPAQQFKRAYTYRSSLLHAGRHPDESVADLKSHDELRAIGLDLEDIVDAIVMNPPAD